MIADLPFIIVEPRLGGKFLPKGGLVGPQSTWTSTVVSSGCHPDLCIFMNSIHYELCSCKIVCGACEFQKSPS